MQESGEMEREFEPPYVVAAGDGTAKGREQGRDWWTGRGFPGLFYNKTGNEMNTAGKGAVILPDPNKCKINQPGAAAPNNFIRDVDLDGWATPVPPTGQQSR